MFSKVLIANRGEIACRVIRTCQRLGVRTVAVYSEADANALHVRQADEAHLLGPSPVSESYLNIDRIIEVAQESGAQAIHPGYGFLSENPRFAQACEDAGIRFVGPSVEAMQRMGDKVLARRLAQEAGLPLIPGTDTDVEDEEALEWAYQIGFPLMVKAAEGGGGIGIRVVQSPEGLEMVLQRARFLAQGAFGSSRMYMEKYLEKASHVEVQVLADSHGNALHLFERDCSVQRRNQKVVEETPCAKIDNNLRRQMTQAALALVRHIGYSNAGTVEFLVDAEGHFYFLEMNTRLQVEHPVTEMVTGVDLVEQQLRVAAGEPLSLRQADIIPHGHAIEARIYSEDPSTLMPSVGVVEDVIDPTGEHIRVDGALFPGYEVSPYYDSLMAKLIVWAEDRDRAIQRLCDALDAFTIRGVTANISLIQRAVTHADFANVTYDTGFLERLILEPSTDGTDKEIAAVIAAAVVALQARERQESVSRWRLRGRRHLMTSRLSSGVPW